MNPMPKRKESGLTQSEQSKRFIKAARELGTDDAPEAFKERLKRLVKAPASKAAQKRKDAK